MARRRSTATLAGLLVRNARTMTRLAQKATAAALEQAAEHRRPPRGAGEWRSGLAVGPAGMRRFFVHRPPDARPGERLPLMVLLHGCGQDAPRFAASTRMNALANRERFVVLYPEQDRVANAQACWNWFDTRAGRAQAEVGLVLAAIDQACLLHGADRERVAIAGLSAGAGLAALAACRHPERFRAVVMHSGVAPGAAHSSATALAAMQGRRTPSLAPHGELPPLLVIQGEDDAVVAAANARTAAHAWAQACGAREGVARVVQRGARHPMHLTEFRRGTETMVALAMVEDLGHAWSGGAAGQPFSDPRGPDASRLAWAFAARRLQLR